MTDAFQEGYLAASRASCRVIVSPYLRGTVAHAVWWEGFKAHCDDLIHKHRPRGPQPEPEFA